MLSKSHKSLGKPKVESHKPQGIAGHDGMTLLDLGPKTAAKGGDLWFSTLGLWSQCGKSRLGNSGFLWLKRNAGRRMIPGLNGSFKWLVVPWLIVVVHHQDYYTFSRESQAKPSLTFICDWLASWVPGGQRKGLSLKTKTEKWGNDGPMLIHILEDDLRTEDVSSG